MEGILQGFVQRCRGGWALVRSGQQLLRVDLFAVEIAVRVRADLDSGRVQRHTCERPLCETKQEGVRPTGRRRRGRFRFRARRVASYLAVRVAVRRRDVPRARVHLRGSFAPYRPYGKAQRGAQNQLPRTGEGFDSL
jgi:hypothetical protein